MCPFTPNIYWCNAFPSASHLIVKGGIRTRPWYKPCFQTQERNISYRVSQSANNSSISVVQSIYPDVMSSLGYLKIEPDLKDSLTHLEITLESPGPSSAKGKICSQSSTESIADVVAGTSSAGSTSIGLDQ